MAVNYYTAQTVSPATEPAIEVPATETPGEEAKPMEEVANVKEPAAEKGKEEKLKTSVRDNTKFKFAGEEYGKGPLVLAVVKRVVEDNPKITVARLKEMFPNELLSRFGIFQEVKEANKMTSGGRTRYFLKAEQVIKLPKEGKTIAVCNQFTAESIKPFLAAAKKAGYAIR